MEDNNLALLPSQESLLQRLLHIASYSEQLKVVCGPSGSGKSSVVTALVNELDEFNSALVVCPLNADDAEIRRKVLVQLLHDPLFDDEVSLAETMLRVSDGLTKPIHIVIDDAHFMSSGLWAECLVLSQVQCAGKPISITLTADADYVLPLMNQLASGSKELILPIAIDSLSLAEREGLYFGLLSRTEASLFLPRDIVKRQLESQQGTPQEVVNLLELALHGEQKKATKPVKMILSLALMAVLISVGLYYGLSVSGGDPERRQVVFAATKKSSGDLLATYGRKLLDNYWLERHETALLQSKNKVTQSKSSADKLGVSLIVTKPLRLKHSVTSPAEESQSNNEIQPNLVAETAIDETIPDLTAQDVTSEQLLDAKAVLSTRVARTSSPPAKDLRASIEHAQEHQSDPKANVARQLQSQLSPKESVSYQEYTLQLAKLSQKKSLDSVLRVIKGQPDIFVLRQKGYYVVTLGNYKTRAEAEAGMRRITKVSASLQPWLRKWEEIQQIELQNHYPNNEIGK
ncbi:AAA family ATPase [Shewanella gelidii]|uniref:ATPase AAA n=1 Tax=Shewanella gelidii TaxID=1642821 RepID=A0A917K0S3_9GAMM|nr:AAA family ATPase [Shewanella gelidii]MCL1099581.1 AAA family ATPase [Shewanella gelidii]GGI92525.1 ATPase AAA [Shewanella gelidii]